MSEYEWEGTFAIDPGDPLGDMIGLTEFVNGEIVNAMAIPASEWGDPESALYTTLLNVFGKYFDLSGNNHE